VAAKIAQRLAPRDHQKAARKLFAFWSKVGVVGKTQVDLSNETGGLVYDPKDYQWAPVDLANRAYGQGVAVTLMQLATGIATIANGGYRVQPHVAAESELADVEPKRVLSPKVARQARDILVHVTGSVPWYAKGSLIPGYLIGGKTGTAQIWDTTIGPKGAWKDNIFNHSFIGFVGGDRPEVVIAVRIEEPKVKVYGQGILESKIESYELFRMIALAAIKHLDIRKSHDRDAGLPIIGTAAARSLTPQRNAAGVQSRRRGRADSATHEAQKGATRKRGERVSRKSSRNTAATSRTDQSTPEVES
jgi:cell division protein FtsI (penicillin-binding protein 3)